jgi:hypothetical protein
MPSASSSPRRSKMGSFPSLVRRPVWLSEDRRRRPGLTAVIWIVKISCICPQSLLPIAILALNEKLLRDRTHAEVGKSALGWPTSAKPWKQSRSDFVLSSTMRTVSRWRSIPCGRVCASPCPVRPFTFIPSLRNGIFGSRVHAPKRWGYLYRVQRTRYHAREAAAALLKMANATPIPPLLPG